MAARITKSFKVNEEIWDMFQMTVAATKDVNYSDVLEQLIHQYNETNKELTQQAIKDYWNKK